MKPLLLIGSGAREHALAQALHQGGAPLYAYANAPHPGLQRYCCEILVEERSDLASLVRFARRHDCQAALVGPEAFLAMGVADALAEANIACVGPTLSLAQIETSKHFSRKLVRATLPELCPEFRYFTSLESIQPYLHTLDDCVIKYDGLLGGKGVWVQGEHFENKQQALELCQSVLAQHANGLVIERKLWGAEFSLLTLCDGNTALHFPPVQDHKRAYEGDLGPNTGGMGSYSCADHLLPFLSSADIARAQRANEQVLEQLQSQQQADYRGVLYGGYMKTTSGLKLIEYNARFGDPEIINLVCLAEMNWAELLIQCALGRLSQCTIACSLKASVCKYLVPQGYPNEPQSGFLDLGQDIPDTHVFLGAVCERDRRLWMTGSRAVAICSTDNDIAVAEQRCEQRIAQCSGNIFHRADIATQPMLDPLAGYKTT